MQLMFTYLVMILRLDYIGSLGMSVVVVEWLLRNHSTTTTPIPKDPLHLAF